jgi:hypothetical protein
MQYKQRTVNRKHRVTIKKAKAKESAARVASKVK